MEFWSVEVKPGEVESCDPGDGKYLHLSQAALGEIQNAKGGERALLHVHIDNKKVVLGALTYGKCDQLSLDIMFSNPFKLSHSCTTRSVFFVGYTAVVSTEQTPNNEGQTPKAKGAVAAKESPEPSTTAGSGKKIPQHVCNTCSRNFATESALSQHNEAKHGRKQVDSSE